MTDGWIIDKGGCHAIARETIDELEKIYEKRQEIFRREKLGKEIEELKIIKKKWIIEKKALKLEKRRYKMLARLLLGKGQK
jgi:hypothetical protein